jgi:hypothetical protein
MKKQSTHLATTLSTTSLQNLVRIVDETLAFDSIPEKKQTFTAAELWNIQRQKKSVRRRSGL